MAGGLPRWLTGRKPEPRPAPDHDDEALQLPDGLGDDIAAVETAALKIYRRHGLPIGPGGYVQRGPEADWEKLPDDLSPLDKMLLLEDAPKDGHWRFVERSGIGRLSPHTEVRRASVLLTACEGLRARLSGRIPTTAQDVADALQLGAASAWLAGARAGEPVMETVTAHTPLVFVPASDDDSSD